MEAAGADCSRIAFLEQPDEEPILLNDTRLAQAIEGTQAKLLVIDPLQAYLRMDSEIQRTNSVRSVLTNLAKVAERTGCAVVLIGHMNKSNRTICNLQAKGEYEIKVDSDRKAILSSEDNYNRYFVLPYVFNSQSIEIDMFDRIINSKFNVETMARGMIHFNVNSYDVIYQMSGFIKMMEENTGEKIADLNEIIKRRKIV